MSPRAAGDSEVDRRSSEGGNQLETSGYHYDGRRGSAAWDELEAMDGMIDDVLNASDCSSPAGGARGASLGQVAFAAASGGAARPTNEVSREHDGPRDSTPSTQSPWSAGSQHKGGSGACLGQEEQAFLAATQDDQGCDEEEEEEDYEQAQVVPGEQEQESEGEEEEEAAHMQSFRESGNEEEEDCLEDSAIQRSDDDQEEALHTQRFQESGFGEDCLEDSAIQASDDEQEPKLEAASAQPVRGYGFEEGGDCLDDSAIQGSDDDEEEAVRAQPSQESAYEEEDCLEDSAIQASDDDDQEEQAAPPQPTAGDAFREDCLEDSVMGLDTTAASPHQPEPSTRLPLTQLQPDGRQGSVPFSPGPKGVPAHRRLLDALASPYAERHRTPHRVAASPAAVPPPAATGDATASTPAADKLRFNALVREARQAEVEGGDLGRALALYREAAAIHPAAPRLRAKIAKLSDRVAASAGEDDEYEEAEAGFTRNRRTGAMHLPGGFALEADTFAHLFPHQRGGVAWMWSLVKEGKGGVLADDMGLGKTVQVAAVLRGALAAGALHAALLVLPVSVMEHWKAELQVRARAASPLRSHTHMSLPPCAGVVHGKAGLCLPRHDEAAAGTHAARRGPRRRGHADHIRHAVQQLGGVGPGRVRDPLATLARSVTHVLTRFSCPSAARWGAVVLDEGHKIKNPSTKMAKAARAMRPTARLILTGTPIQNNLQELWALFDFAEPGLLGDAKAFKRQFSDPILKAQDRLATETDRRLGTESNQALWARIRPHFLRREKRDTLPAGDRTPDADTAAVPSPRAAPATPAAAAPGAGPVAASARRRLPPKHEFAVWCPLADAQLRVYRAFLESPVVREAMSSSRSPLAALSVLLVRSHAHTRMHTHAHALTPIPPAQKICLHPIMLRSTKAEDAILPYLADDTAALMDLDLEELSALAHGTLADEVPRCEKVSEALLASSGKLQVLAPLCDELMQGGHRTLVFSQSKRMLNVVGVMLRARGVAFERLDGDTASSVDRQATIQRFSDSPDIPFFLITTGVGSEGITVTAADRVIILDPSWNPARDSQAVDRTYRIGQTRPVMVHRFVTAATIEEKMYRKQIFKGGLVRTVMRRTTQQRYFTTRELRAMFVLGDPARSELCDMLRALSVVRQCMAGLPPAISQHVRRVEGSAAIGLTPHHVLFDQPLDEATLEELNAEIQRTAAVTQGFDHTPAPPRAQARRPPSTGAEATEGEEETESEGGAEPAFPARDRPQRRSGMRRKSVVVVGSDGEENEYSDEADGDNDLFEVSDGPEEEAQRSLLSVEEGPAQTASPDIPRRLDFGRASYADAVSRGNRLMRDWPALELPELVEAAGAYVTALEADDRDTELHRRVVNLLCAIEEKQDAKA